MCPRPAMGRAVSARLVNHHQTHFIFRWHVIQLADFHSRYFLCPALFLQCFLERELVCTAHITTSSNMLFVFSELPLCYHFRDGEKHHAEVNISFHKDRATSCRVSQFPNGGNHPLLFVAEEPRPLHWTRTSHHRRHIGRYFPTKLPEGYRRQRRHLEYPCAQRSIYSHISYFQHLDEGSTTQIQAHIHLYTAPKLPKEVNRRLEPKPSARVVELPIKVELISKHYKCLVITVILWKHIYWVGSQLLPIYTIAISWAYCKSP